MSPRLKAGLVLAAIAAALVVSSFETTTAQTANGSGKVLTWVVEGNYRVAFDCAFPDKTTKSDKVEQVKRIEFHPEYIVIVDQNDSGRVVPVHSLKQLKWEPS
jgi:hypothetical protein